MNSRKGWTNCLLTSKSWRNDDLNTQTNACNKYGSFRPYFFNNFIVSYLMLRSIIKVSHIEIGEIAIYENGNTKFTTGVLCEKAFAIILTPAITNKSIDSFAFQLKDQSFMTINRLKPKRIVTSLTSPLSILIFDESKDIVSLIRSLQITINPYKLREANIFANYEVRLHGYHVQSTILNRQKYVTSSKKVYGCEYRMCLGNQIHFNCYQNRDGMVGAPISLEDQTWIGLYVTGKDKYCSGLLFTEEIIQGMLDMFKEKQIGKTQVSRKYSQTIEFDEFNPEANDALQDTYDLYLRGID